MYFTEKNWAEFKDAFFKAKGKAQQESAEVRAETRKEIEEPTKAPERTAVKPAETSAQQPPKHITVAGIETDAKFAFREVGMVNPKDGPYWVYSQNNFQVFTDPKPGGGVRYFKYPESKDINPLNTNTIKTEWPKFVERCKEAAKTNILTVEEIEALKKALGSKE